MKTLNLILATVLAGYSGAVGGLTQPASAAAPCTYISAAKADSIALAAVGGGTVITTVLEKNDNPVDWSVDVKAKTGKEYEVKVNACTGKVITIIVGG